jgi:hypothetical protein
MRTVRVVLAGMPPLLHDAVHAIIDAEPDLRVVGEGASAEVPADVVILSAGAGAADGVLAAALERRDATRVVVVAADGRAAYVCTPRGELSATTLREAVRGQD